LIPEVENMTTDKPLNSQLSQSDDNLLRDGVYTEITKGVIRKKLSKMR